MFLNSGSGDPYLKVFSVQSSLYGWMVVTNGDEDLLLNALSAKCRHIYEIILTVVTGKQPYNHCKKCYFYKVHSQKSKISGLSSVNTVSNLKRLYT